MIQKERKTRLLKLDVLGWRFEHEALESIGTLAEACPRVD
jgi:hypothetical protein